MNFSNAKMSFSTATGTTSVRHLQWACVFFDVVPTVGRRRFLLSTSKEFVWYLGMCFACKKCIFADFSEVTSPPPQPLFVTSFLHFLLWSKGSLHSLLDICDCLGLESVFLLVFLKTGLQFLFLYLEHTWMAFRKSTFMMFTFRVLNLYPTFGFPDIWIRPLLCLVHKASTVTLWSLS